MRIPALASSPIEQDDFSCFEILTALLSEDLDFHSQNSDYASHNFHAFPAKFPPQLPRKFIQALTIPGDIVLDPMMGSGTTVLETFLMGRQGIGFDIDPLARLVTQVKVTSLNIREVTRMGEQIVANAKISVAQYQNDLERERSERWDDKTGEFVNYWFTPDVQLALLALLKEIEKIPDMPMRAFFELAFSAIIITKSGGVSLALDLAHTRPHRARVVIDQTGQVIMGHDLHETPSRRLKHTTKKLRSPFEEFEKRVAQNIKGLPARETDRIQPYLTGMFKPEPQRIPPRIAPGNAQQLPLDDQFVDLIITSPPYASNAIDYMRAHKFSLVWFGHSIDDLGETRRDCIGGESILDIAFEALPEQTTRIVEQLTSLDPKKGRVLHRYYAEMTRVLREMFRVLKPGKSAVVVVGNSVIRGLDTETQHCLSEIGQNIGFEVPGIGVRHLDRNRRMMPAGLTPDMNSQIQQRMHEEYVIGFYKPLC